VTAARTRRRARLRRGFTLIEVMISLGIMTMGAMAMIALQQYTIRSNGHAREVAIGTQIAQQWVERLKQDAHLWTRAAVNADDVDVVLAGTEYLRAIGTDTRNLFRSPAYDAANRLVSGVYDYRGTPLPQVAGNDEEGVPYQNRIFFCTSIREDWVYFGRAMRADVRVWWPRQGAGAVIADDFPAGWCQDTGGLSPGQPLFDRYHVIYLSTVIRMNPVVR
jgi:type IV pilus modification protein PilV